MNDKTPPPPQKPNVPQVPGWGFLVVFVLVLAVSIVSEYVVSSRRAEEIPYSQFLQWVKADKISDVTLSDTKIVGELKEGKKIFSTNPVNDPELPALLLKKNIVFRSEPRSSFWGSILGWVIPFFVFYFAWNFLFRRMYGPTQGGLLGITKSKAKVYVERDVQTTFDDVAGVDEAKEELKELVSFLRDPKRFTRLGGRAPKGLLLVGPPGTGKTLLARALAGEAEVPFFSINGSEFVEMFVGLGAARVRDMFQEARGQAPCLLFIDEIDAMGKSRAYGLVGSGSNDEKEQTLHQLLAEMDGFDTSEGVIILAATNRPEVLDPALLRAGRFDRQVLVPLPDQIGRAQILKVHAAKVKLDSEVKLEQIAALTSGFSGADLANLVNEAALIATRRDGESVSQSDLTQAIERIVAGIEQKKKAMNPEEKKRVAYHEMGHATVSLCFNLPDKIHKISVIPRGLGALGYTLQRPVEDRYLADYKELVNKIAILMGGRASEKLFFEEISTGAADDLVKATDIARAMVTQYGMSEEIGLAVFEQRRAPFLQPDFFPAFEHKAFSELTAQHIDAEIKAILEAGFRQAFNGLKLNKTFIEEGAQRLLEVETLDEQEVLSLWKRFGHLANGKSLSTAS